MSRKILNFLSFFSIGSAIVFLLVVIYWAIYPYEVLEFHEGNGTFKVKQVKGGDYIEMYQKNCKKMDVFTTINRQFVDGIIYQVPTTINNRPVGCFDTSEFVYVPKALPPGFYQIRTTISAKVNPIRTMSYVVVTEEFEILK